MSDTYADIATYCKGKPGAENDWSSFEIFEVGSLLEFACIEEDDEEDPTGILRLRSYDNVWNALRKKKVSISPSKGWDAWENKMDDWKWIDLRVDDGSIKWEAVKSLIDDSYEITLKDLTDAQRQRLGLVRQKLEPKEILDQLIENCRLVKKKVEIKKLLTPALMLRTVSGSESHIKLGESKIGGRPDLPKTLEWPTYNDKPMAFLAQINLSEIPDGPRIAGTPCEGTLYFFSAFGWKEKDSLDPTISHENWGDGCTQVLYNKSKRAKLTRQKKPRSVNAYPAARVSFEYVKLMPSRVEEPAVAKLGIRGKSRDKFEELFAKFNKAALDQIENSNQNFLYGYASFVQDFDPCVADQKLRLLFQLSSDGNAHMSWGDDGYVYFWVKPAHLSKKNFTRIYTGCQGF